VPIATLAPASFDYIISDGEYSWRKLEQDHLKVARLRFESLGRPLPVANGIERQCIELL
jgi:hypothetical protein